MITNRETKLQSRDVISPNKDSKSQDNVLSHFNIFKYFAKTKAERSADEYINWFRDESKDGHLIKTIINSSESSEVLEALLIHLGKANYTDLKIPSRKPFVGNANPFSECVGESNSAKLAVMLRFYDIDVNAKFWIKNENGNEYLCIHPLLKAFLYQAKADIRLLLLYGAVLISDDIKKMHPDCQNIRISDSLRTFERSVLEEVKNLLSLNLAAINSKTSRDYKNAFSQYRDLGNCYLEFSLSCKNECNAISKKPLTAFYLSEALTSYIEALVCVEICLKSPIFSKEEFNRLYNDLYDFYDKVCANIKPYKDNDFLKRDFSVFTNKWQNIFNIIKKIHKAFQQAEIDDQDENDFRSTQVLPLPRNSISDTESSSDSENGNEEDQLIRRRFR